MTKETDEMPEDVYDKMRAFIDERVDFSEQPNETAKDAYIYHLQRIASQGYLQQPTDNAVIRDLSEALEEDVEILKLLALGKRRGGRIDMAVEKSEEALTTHTDRIQQAQQSRED